MGSTWELQSRNSNACYRIKMSAQTKVEVTRGVFDPRTYKQEDKQNWARKRKPEWMATTGQIHFVRERTVASQERELEEERRAQAAQDDASQDLKAAVQEDPAPVPVKVEICPRSSLFSGLAGREVTSQGMEGSWATLAELSEISRHNHKYLSPAPDYLARDDYKVVGQLKS